MLPYITTNPDLGPLLLDGAESLVAFQEGDLEEARFRAWLVARQAEHLRFHALRRAAQAFTQKVHPGMIEGLAQTIRQFQHELDIIVLAHVAHSSKRNLTA